MNFIIAGHDRLGIAAATAISEAGHEVIIAEQERVHLRSLPKSLVDQENVTPIHIDPTLDESMTTMGIHRCDVFIAAMSSDADNGLAALKAKITYHVQSVVAFVTDESLSRVYPRFGIITINPYRLALEKLAETFDAINQDSDGEPVENFLAAVVEPDSRVTTG